jgi:hypothetical protein
MFRLGKKSEEEKKADTFLAKLVEDGEPLSPEQIEKFMQDIKGPLKQHEQEKRRSLEINAGFFDKLAALSAGSIAVTSSIILAILFKSETRPPWVPPALHELLSVVVFLWLSLVLAILHNFLATRVGTTAAEQSEAELTWAMAEQAMAISKLTTPAIDGAVMRQAKDLLRKQFAPREVKLVNRSRALYATVSVFGYGSMSAFVVAFSLVPIYLFRLW